MAETTGYGYIKRKIGYYQKIQCAAVKLLDNGSFERITTWQTLYDAQTAAQTRAAKEKLPYKGEIAKG